MQEAEPALAADVAQWFSEAAAADAREDAACGADRRGDALPAWVAHKQQRLAKIRAAKAALEAEAQAAAAAEQPPPDAAAPPPPAVPPATAERNFTDPDSRIMKGPAGFVQADNAQAAVDAAHQIIVAQTLTASSSDMQQLEPLVAQIKRNTRRQAREVSADAGYCAEANLKALSRRHIRGYVATGRQRHGHASATGARRPAPGTRVAAMWRRLKQGGYRSRYRLRKQVVEPVFGQIKHARGFRQFLLRGHAQVAAEWSLVCTAHNLLKLAAATG